MIKAIIFDNGGVLVEDTWLDFQLVASCKMGISLEEFRAQVKPIVSPATTGQITKEDVLAGLEGFVGSQQDIAEMLTTPTPWPSMEKWLEELISDGYQLSMLSNDFGDFPESNKIWKYDRYFGDRIFHSSALGVMKPDLRAYTAVIAATGFAPEEILFIDDKVKNVEAARSLGLFGIQFITEIQVKNDFQKLIEREHVQK